MHFAVVALRCDTVWPPDCLPRLTDADGRMEGEEEKERRDMILIPEEGRGRSEERVQWRQNLS